MQGCTISTFSFNEVVVTVNGVEIQGFAKESDAITIEYREDAGPLEVSADGVTAVHIANNDISGRVALKLNQGSNSNVYLSTLFQLAKKGAPGGYGVTSVTNLSNGDIWILQPCYVFNHTSVSYGNALNNREWEIVGVCLNNAGSGISEIVSAGTL